MANQEQLRILRAAKTEALGRLRAQGVAWRETHDQVVIDLSGANDA